MYEQNEAKFAERYDRYCTKLKDLGVPLAVWKGVLIELYFPVDWLHEPEAFTELGHTLETFGDSTGYNLTRPDGMSDHDYARGLLMQAQKRRDERRAWVAENMSSEFVPVPPLEEEDDDAILEAYFADREKRRSLN